MGSRAMSESLNTSAVTKPSDLENQSYGRWRRTRRPETNLTANSVTAFSLVVWRSGEFLIGTRDGIFKCQTVKARPEQSAYDPECIDYIVKNYNAYVLEGAKTKGATATFAEPRILPPPSGGLAPRAGNEWVRRRVYIKLADFKKYGFTQGCKGCAWLQTGLGARQGHSMDCRTRMEAAMAEDDDDKHRILNQKNKMDAYVAAEG